MTQRAKAASGNGAFGKRATALAEWAADVAADAARGAAIALGIAPAQGLQPVPVRVRSGRRSENG